MKLNETPIKYRVWIVLFIIFIAFINFAVAHDKVVVIPLFDDQNHSGPPAPVPKTGQTTSYYAEDDGDLRYGVTWPDPRFKDNNDGTVTDNLTGLYWIKKANWTGAPHTWTNAIAACNSCGVGGYDDWRLPNRNEMVSLLDLGQEWPALPSGHPFTDVINGAWIWTSTTLANSIEEVWSINLWYGTVAYGSKDANYHSWCVRGGNQK